MRDELVRRAQQGDAEAFDSLARTVGDRCLAIAVRILRGLARRSNEPLLTGAALARTGPLRHSAVAVTVAIAPE